MAMAINNVNVPRKAWSIEKLTLVSIVDAMDNKDALANVIVGRYAGFDIYISALVANTAGAKYRIIAAWNQAATYAVQIEKTKTIRHPKQFADVVRGFLAR